MVHHHHAVGHRQRLFLVVRHQDRGHAEPSLQQPDLAAQPLALLGIEGRQRLVEQQQARRGGQRPRQRDALLLAAGQLRRILRPRIRQADQLQQLRHPGIDLGAAPAPVHQPVGDVVADGQVGKQRVRLEDDAVVARRRRRAGDVAPVLDHPAARLRLQPGDDPQQGRLAAAGRPDEADQLAALDREIDRLQRDKAAEGLVDAFEPERFGRGLVQLHRERRLARTALRMTNGGGCAAYEVGRRQR